MPPLAVVSPTGMIIQESWRIYATQVRLFPFGRPTLCIDTGGEFSSAQRDHATMWRAENREIRVFAEGVSLCHSATLTRLTATAVMTCCKRVFAKPM